MMMHVINHGERERREREREREREIGLREERAPRREKRAGTVVRSALCVAKECTILIAPQMRNRRDEILKFNE